eukprot:173673-Lingulodinium_polyedra.AAC.1
MPSMRRRSSSGASARMASNALAARYGMEPGPPPRGSAAWMLLRRRTLRSAASALRSAASPSAPVCLGAGARHFAGAG